MDIYQFDRCEEEEGAYRRTVYQLKDGDVIVWYMSMEEISETKVKSERVNATVDMGTMLDLIVKERLELSRFRIFFLLSRLEVRRRMMKYLLAYAYGGLVTMKERFHVPDRRKTRGVILMRDRNGINHSIYCQPLHPFMMEVLESAIDRRQHVLFSERKEAAFLESAHGLHYMVTNPKVTFEEGEIWWPDEDRRMMTVVLTYTVLILTLAFFLAVTYTGMRR